MKNALRSANFELGNDRLDYETSFNKFYCDNTRSTEEVLADDNIAAENESSEFQNLFCRDVLTLYLYSVDNKGAHFTWGEDRCDWKSVTMKDYYEDKGGDPAAERKKKAEELRLHTERNMFLPSTDVQSNTCGVFPGLKFTNVLLGDVAPDYTTSNGLKKPQSHPDFKPNVPFPPFLVSIAPLFYALRTIFSPALHP